VCVGAFILAATGVLKQRAITTHWDREILFNEYFPEIQLDTDKILINEGDVITAGGIMSWLDLGLKIVAQCSSEIESVQNSVSRVI